MRQAMSAGDASCKKLVVSRRIPGTFEIFGERRHDVLCPPLQPKPRAEADQRAGERCVTAQIELANVAQRHLHVEVLKRRRGAGKSADELALDAAEILAATEIAFDFPDAAMKKAGRAAKAVPGLFESVGFPAGSE